MLGKRVYAPSWRTQSWKKRKVAVVMKPRSKISLLTKQVRAIRKSQELKYFDTILTSATGGQVSPINSVPLGDDATTRDGRKILMKRIDVNLILSAAGGALSPFPRYAIVYDKANNGALPVVTSIYTASSADAMPNVENQDRFKILYDNFSGMFRGRDPIQSITGGDLVSFIDTVKVPCNLETRFSPTDPGTIAGTYTGALYLVFLGSGTTTTSSIRSRVMYYDS